MNVKDKLIDFEKKKINGAAKKTFINSGWLITDKVVTMIIGIFITAVIARYLGPENYGKFNYALAFVSLFTAISTLGLEVLTVKSIVNKDENEGTILYTSLILRIIGGGILIILSSIFIRLIEPNDSMLHILVLIMSFSMLIKSFEVIEYWIQAYQLAKVTSIIHIMTTLITAILKIGLIIFNGGLIAFALIYTIDAILISIALTISYFKLRENRSFWKVSIVYGRGILRQSWYLILSGLMITMYMRLDQVMLGYMMDTKVELGIYSASARIAEMWYFIPMAVITSFRPVIMKKKGDNIDYIDSIQKLYKIIAWMGILIGIIIIILAKPIILILYGVDYLSASKILSVSIWAGTFAMLGSARSIWLVCEGLQKFTLAYTFGGLIVNIILNYFLIPHYGAFGAAVATLVSQFFANIVVLSLFKKTRISSIMILKSFIPKFHLKK